MPDGLNDEFADSFVEGFIAYKRSKKARKLQPHFQDLSENGQHPVAVFIACGDSRVDPNLITHSSPGLLFPIRNVGNIIPPFDPNSRHSEFATLQYNLSVLDVKQVIICGHSKCGAMCGLLQGNLNKLTQVSGWVAYAEPALEELKKLHPELEGNEELQLKRLTELNIIQQIKNLNTYPLIKEKNVRISGWYYDISKQSIYVYKENQFIPIEEIFAQRQMKKVVQEMANDYLTQFIRPQTSAEYLKLITIFETLNKDNNIKSIWPEIKELVLERLEENLGDLYEDRENEFAALVESAFQLPFNNLDQFKPIILESKGYKKYCSSLLRNYLFSPPSGLDYFCTGTTLRVFTQ